MKYAFALAMCGTIFLAACDGATEESASEAVDNVAADMEAYADEAMAEEVGADADEASMGDTAGPDDFDMQASPDQGPSEPAPPDVTGL